MVQLTLTAAGKAAIAQYLRLRKETGNRGDETLTSDHLSDLETGSPIDHAGLIKISQYLVQHSRNAKDSLGKEWRLDTLLKGANVYQKPPPPKPEPVRFHRISN
jgi:TMEM199 family protein